MKSGVVAGFLLGLLALGQTTERQGGQLRLGVPFEQTLGPGQADVFAVPMAAGQFAHVVAQQAGVDVVVTVVGPDGRVIVRADSPNNAAGPEPASWIARGAGSYRVVVAKSGRSGETGQYRIALTDLRGATAADGGRIEAETSLFKAVRDERTGGDDQRPAAIQEYEQAAALWHGVNDAYEEALCLHESGALYSAIGERQKAVHAYGQALTIAHSLGNRLAEGTILDEMGKEFIALHERQMARQALSQALVIARDSRNQLAVATVLNDIGLAYAAFGEKQRALDYFNQLLPLSRSAQNRVAEATLLNEMGVVYGALGDQPKALECFGQALPISRAIGNKHLEVTTLTNAGQTYVEQGQMAQALDVFGQALTISRAGGFRLQEVAVLTDLGNAYANLGQSEKSLETLGELLTLSRTVKSRTLEAMTLNNIGRVYWALGARPKALDSFSQALVLSRAVGNRSLEATTLNNVGRLESELGDLRKALESDDQAFRMASAIADRSLQAVILTNAGRAFLEAGEAQQALEYNGRALPLARELGLRFVEERVLENTGLAYSQLGDAQKALTYDSQALALARAVSDRGCEGRVLSNISVTLKAMNRRDAAICFGKQAVNVFQSVRRDNQRLADELKQSYQTSIEGAYRNLAGLLVERERFGEAEEVLSLLKQKETSDYERDSVADVLRPATLLESEKKDLAAYEQNLGQLVTLGQQLAALQTKKDENKAQWTAADAEQEARLNGQLDAANGVFERFLKEVGKPLAGNSAAARNVDKASDESQGIREALQRMRPDVVAIYTLVMPDKYVALLVTSGTRKAYTTAIAEKDLNQKIFDFRRALESSASNPLPLAQELYRVVFPEGLRRDLDALHAKTIMWSIDSTLRYVPMAALHDGHDYLVKTYANSLITPAFLEHLNDAAAGVWQGTGFGVSETKDQAQFTELPSVKVELQGIFRQSAAETGPIAGRYLLNAEFTRAAFLGLRGQGNHVVHIATHFDSEPGEARNSRLLLGDGPMSLDEIRKTQGLFKGVDLLTLSACSTAFTDKAGEDGREVDSFGTIAQRLGAKGVIASLWSVNDDATARLMERMYRLRQENPGAGKSEALRRAQAEMASGVMKAGSGGAADRAGIPVRKAAAAAKDWTHPYYWAPFILIGNWK